MAMKRTAPAERFWRKVTKTDTCWLWTGAQGGGGYGVFFLGGDKRTMRAAHRVSWEFTHGPIASGLVLNHLCRVRTCVNPAHLEAVTQVENLRYSDSVLGVRTGRTHCPQGHEYTAENLIVSTQGWRKCKTCHRLRARETRRS